VYQPTTTAQRPTNRILALTIAFLTAVWAINYITAKIALRHIDPLTFASFRLVLAGIFMFAIYLFCLRLPAFADAVRARRIGWTRHDLWIFLYLGFFGVAINQFCFTVGMRYTSVIHSAIISSLSPIYTLILAVLFRLENPTLRKVLGMLVAFAGVILMSAGAGLSRHSPSLLGDAITLTGSLGFAMYVVLGKRVAARYDPLTMSIFNSFFGALIVLPLAIHRAILIGSFDHWRAIPWPVWVCMVYMALFSSAIAYALYFWALRYFEATQLATFTYLLPILGIALGIIFLGERGSWLELLGALFALAAVYYVESSRDPKPVV
jgi:drug/metabolite transporter (DMT)-like permease